ncbi:pullulanase, partial [Vibrio parahaemolyticus V-223/04]
RKIQQRSSATSPMMFTR